MTSETDRLSRHSVLSVVSDVVAKMTTGAQDDALVAACWETYALWLATDPARISIDRTFPDWHNLSPEQQAFLSEMSAVPSWGNLTTWKAESFRKACDMFLGRLVVGVLLATKEIEDLNEERKRD